MLIKAGLNGKKSVVYTDCLGVVEELGGKLNNVSVAWVPREMNEAHGMSVTGRTMTWWSTSKYRNFEKLNGNLYL